MRSSLRWLAVDTLTLTGRELSHWVRQPAPALIGWAFPAMIALMFGGLFGGAMEVPGGLGYFSFLMPGMFAVTMFFGLESTMLAVTADASKGVTDRFRSLPMNSAAVVAGRCLADLLYAVIGLGLMILLALALGWRWQGTLLEATGAVGLLLLFRMALLWVGVSLGLAAGSPELVMAVQILIWPVSFLSSVFVDPSTMPGWLGMLAEWNPLSATATAARQLFGAPLPAGGSWASEHAVLLAVLWPLVLTLIFLPLAARQYRNLGR